MMHMHKRIGKLEKKVRILLYITHKELTKIFRERPVCPKIRDV